MPCLTVSALNGTLAGGAFGMALACDLRIAVSEAEIFYPVIRLGFLPQPSDPARQSALVGPWRAGMILLAGQRIDANRALEWGLVDAATPRGDLPALARALAEAPLAASAAHVARVKALCAAS